MERRDKDKSQNKLYLRLSERSVLMLRMVLILFVHLSKSSFEA